MTIRALQILQSAANDAGVYNWLHRTAVIRPSCQLLQLGKAASGRQACWMPLGHVRFFTGSRIASTSRRSSSSMPDVDNSSAAATFSSTLYQENTRPLHQKSLHCHPKSLSPQANWMILHGDTTTFRPCSVISFPCELEWIGIDFDLAMDLNQLRPCSFI